MNLKLILIAVTILAHNTGEWNGISPELRQWFRSVKSPTGVPCCDIADGHATDYDIRGNEYWVPNPEGGPELRVPPEAVVLISNPTGRAIVWFAYSDGTPTVRCFVPGGGV